MENLKENFKISLDWVDLLINVEKAFPQFEIYTEPSLEEVQNKCEFIFYSMNDLFADEEAAFRLNAQPDGSSIKISFGKEKSIVNNINELKEFIEKNLPTLENNEFIINGYVVRKSDTSDNYFVYDNNGHVEDDEHKGQGYPTKEAAIERANSLEKGIAHINEHIVVDKYDQIDDKVKSIIELITESLNPDDELENNNEDPTEEEIPENEDAPVSSEKPLEDEKNPEAVNGVYDLLMEIQKDELATIQKYNSMIVTCEAEGYEDIAKVIRHITDEENIHVGMVQAAAQTISTMAREIKKGEQETIDILNGEETHD